MILATRGCKPQSCALCDDFKELKQLGVDWFYGLSTQKWCIHARRSGLCNCRQMQNFIFVKRYGYQIFRQQARLCCAD